METRAPHQVCKSRVIPLRHDINGDDKQEIAVNSGSYQGGGLSEWSLDGRAVKKVAASNWKFQTNYA